MISVYVVHKYTSVIIVCALYIHVSRSATVSCKLFHPMEASLSVIDQRGPPVVDSLPCSRCHSISHAQLVYSKQCTNAKLCRCNYSIHVHV